MTTVRRLPARLALLIAIVSLLSSPAAAAPIVGFDHPTDDDPSAQSEDGLFFPVQLPLDAMDDTWGAARSGHRHQGTDILARHMAPVYAAVDGEIIRAKGEECVDGQVCRDYYLALAGDDGRGYFYVHLNDDTPGRPNGCDGVGGVDNAFAPRLVDALQRRGTLTGVRVQAGEHIGYNGSSGNADCGVDHVHFEIWDGHEWGASGKTNPYDELVAAMEAGDAAHRADGDPARPGQRAADLRLRGGDGPDPWARTHESPPNRRAFG